MMREYKTYDEYKGSEVEWIGEIPSHWELIEIKRVAKIITGNTPKKSNNKYYKNGYIDWIKPDNINEDFSISDSEEKLNKKGLKKSKGLIPKNSTIVNCIGMIGKAGFNRKPLTTNQQINSVVFNEDYINKKFGFYFIVASKEEHKRNSTKVVVAILNKTQQGQIDINVPPKKEQQKIASFLDQKTAEIDKIINKKENLIDHLEKYKKSVITEAVTKGKLGDKYINEDGKLVDEIEMKDSGVEWIGEIPEFIEAVKIKRLTQIKRGASPRPIDNPIYFDDNGEYSWVRISDVTKSDDYLLDTEQTLSKLGASKSVKMNKGDIFLSIAATVGKPIITKIKCCIHDGFVYFPEYKESKKFLFYIFKSEQPYRGLGKHGTQINLNTTIVGDIKIPYFKKRNQEKIAKYLDKKTRQIDKLIQKTKESIDKYKEYKKSLIFEAVTGKIDLRDYELEGGKEVAEHNNSGEIKRKELSEVN